MKLILSLLLVLMYSCSHQQAHEHKKEDAHYGHKGHDHHKHHHEHHKNHAHNHAAKCGHKAEKHDDHTDYEHDGHHHHQLDNHTHECESVHQKVSSAELS